MKAKRLRLHCAPFFISRHQRCCWQMIPLPRPGLCNPCDKCASKQVGVLSKKGLAFETQRTGWSSLAGHSVAIPSKFRCSCIPNYPKTCFTALSPHLSLVFLDLLFSLFSLSLPSLLSLFFLLLARFKPLRMESAAA